MIETVRSLRRHVVDALLPVLQSANMPIAESALRDAFVERLKLIPGLCSAGWYSPPPDGIILATGSPPDFERTSRQSYRPEATWPSATEYLTPESILLAYASPVAAGSGLIGDIGCTLYRGNNRKIKQHLRNVLDITLEIAHTVEAGQTLSEINEAGSKIMSNAGYENVVYSNHGGATTDFGHTLPWSDGSLTDSERSILNSGDLQQIADLVAGARHYVNANDHFVIADTCAVTIEPRPSTPELPSAFYHVVVAFENGRKEIITGFEPLMELFEMDV